MNIVKVYLKINEHDNNWHWGHQHDDHTTQSMLKSSFINIDHHMVKTSQYSDDQ